MGTMGRRGSSGQNPAFQPQETRAQSGIAVGPPRPMGPATSSASQGASASSALLFQNMGARSAADIPQPSFHPRNPNWSPMTPASRLPQIYSSDDEDGKQSFTSLSDVEGRRTVRFSSNVVESSESEDDEPNFAPRKRPRSNTVTTANPQHTRRPGGGKASEHMRPAMGGHAVPEIWHPPASMGKGNEQQQQQQAFAPPETWRVWRG